MVSELKLTSGWQPVWTSLIYLNETVHRIPFLQSLVLLETVSGDSEFCQFFASYYNDYLVQMSLKSANHVKNDDNEVQRTGMLEIKLWT